MSTRYLSNFATIGIVAAFALSANAAAQPATALRDAIEAAWQRSPAGRVEASRREELAARRLATNAFTPEAPSLNFEQWNDALSGNDGFRKFAGDVGLPLWLPGQRASQRSVIEADEALLTAANRANKWRLAGEVRDAYWQARLAAAELRLALRKVEDAAALANDIARRVAAGDLPLVDSLQARAAEQAARASSADAEGRVLRARGVYLGLTGIDALPSDEESVVEQTIQIDEHPQLVGLRAMSTAAKARLTVAQTTTRDTPELGIGMFRERGNFADPFKNVFTFRVRIPLSTDARNKPRIAAANAELIEAQAAYVQQRLKVETDADAARRELVQSRAMASFAAERARLAGESQALIARAFSLGQFDLPARLRAETERFDAELSAERARLELARAASRVNQSLGMLP